MPLYTRRPLLAGVTRIIGSLTINGAPFDPSRPVTLGANFAEIDASAPGAIKLGNEYWTVAGAGGAVVWDLPLRVGERLTTIQCYGEVAVTTAFHFTLYENDPVAATLTPLGDIFCAPVAGVQTVTIPFTALTVVAPKYYSVRWGAGAAPGSTNNRARCIIYSP